MVLAERTLLHALESLELLRTIHTPPNPKVRLQLEAILLV